MFLFHPSKKTLKKWLEGADLPRVEKHLANCEKCAKRIERLEESSASFVGQALSMVLSPPEDFPTYIEEKIETEADATVSNLLGDLFGAGFETSSILFLEEDKHDS